MAGGRLPALPHDLYLAATAKNRFEYRKSSAPGWEGCRNKFKVPADRVYGTGSSPFTANPFNHWLLLEVCFRYGSPSAFITMYLLDAHGSMTVQEVHERVRHLGLASWEHRIWKLQKLRASTIDGTCHRVLSLISALTSQALTLKGAGLRPNCILICNLLHGFS